MRRALSIVALASALAPPALADGMPGSIKDTYVPVIATWSGCYIGLDTGYKWGRTRFTSPNPYNLNNNTALVVTTTDQNLRTDGGLIGGQFGCNYRVTHRLYVGFEASATRDWAKDGASNIPVQTTSVPPRTAGTTTTDVERTCQIHVGPRVGLTTGAGLSPLVYVTGGYAGSCVRTGQAATIQLVTTTNNNVSTDSFQNGWYLGTGVDIPTGHVIKNTFVQIEWSRSDYGSSNVALGGSAATGRVENVTNEIRFGFKYRFQ